MDGIFHGYDIGVFTIALKTPCGHRIPVLIASTVGRRILEIAILNQFGIQTTVGGIIDILEEYTHKFVGYRISFVRIGFNHVGGDFESGETHRILMHTLAIKPAEAVTLHCEQAKVTHKHPRNTYYIALHLLAVDGKFIDFTVARSGHLVVLRMPLLKVWRRHDGQYGVIRVGNPRRGPATVGITGQYRAKHFFMASPRAEIGTYKIVVGTNQLPVGRAVGTPCKP